VYVREVQPTLVRVACRFYLYIHSSSIVAFLIPIGAYAGWLLHKSLHYEEVKCTSRACSPSQEKAAFKKMMMEAYEDEARIRLREKQQQQFREDTEE
jgi:hypothetical protein